MDWKSNAHAWDFTHFPQQPIPDVDALGGAGEFLVDLKLGQEGEPTASRNRTSTPVKRLRGAANAVIQPAGCLVDGCDSDLSNCREYHRRHKVCERHSKTPVVTIAGYKKRFCQQCSRFHSLEEFDEEKRSCRKRLDGHNRRRRKPHPEPPFHSANFMSGYQGMELSPFSAPPMYPPNLQHDHKPHQQLPWKQSPFFMEGGGGAQLPCLQPGEFPGTQMHALDGPSSSGSCCAPSLLSVLVPRPACTVPSWETGLPHCSSPAEQQLPVHFPNMLEAMELGVDPDPVTGGSSVDGSGKVPETIPFYWE